MRSSLMILLLMTGFAAPGDADMSIEENPLVLGAVYNLHGFQANLDVPSSRGARLAVAEVNRSGGLLSRPVSLALVDGRSEPAVIARETTALLQAYPDMPALVGLSDTDMVLAAAPLAAARGKLFLTSGATSPLLPGEVPDYLLLACFGDNVQAAAAAETAWNDLGARSAAVLYDADHSYTSLLQGYFRNRFTALGGAVVAVGDYSDGALDSISAAVTHADIVFLATASADEALSIIQRLRASGVRAPVLGGDSYDSEALWQRYPAIEDVYFTTHAYLGADNPNPQVIAFRKAYAEAYNDNHPDAFAALGYDTVRLLMSAIRAAGSSEPAAVREALSGIRDFVGATGALHFPTGSRVPLKSVSVLQVKSGGVSLFKEFAPAQVPPP